MKHNDWLRLSFEGEQICAVFRQQGYQCKKQTRRLSWQLCSLGQDDYSRRFLNRYMPASEFQVVFDVPNSREPDDQT